VLFGDSGVRTETEQPCDPGTSETPVPAPCRAALLASIAADRPDAVFVLGDLVYEFGPDCGGTLDDASRARFDDLIGTLQAGVDAPLVLALGNHDVHQSTTGHDAAEACYLAWAAEQPDIHLPARNFVVEIGPATIPVFDTNRYPDAALAADVAAVVESSTRAWTFFAAHHVWKTYDDKEGEDHGPRWAARVGSTPDLWLNAHAHLLQMGEYDGVAAVTSGASGKLRATTACGGEEAACDRAGLLFTRAQYGYALVVVRRDAVEVTFKDVLGAPLFAWSRTR